MRTLFSFLSLTVATAILALPGSVSAQPPAGEPPVDKPSADRPGLNPEAHFAWLDANDDGFITEDEVPQRFGRSPGFYPAADQDEDQKISKEELLDWIEERIEWRKDRYDGRRGARDGRRFSPGQGRYADDFFGPRAGRRGPGFGPGRPGFPVGPDPKAIFDRLDKDDDGQLSEAEFTKGMERLHQRMMRRHYSPQGRLGQGRPGYGPGRFDCPAPYYGRPDGWYGGGRHQMGPPRGGRGRAGMGPWDQDRFDFPPRSSRAIGMMRFAQLDQNEDGRLDKAEVEGCRLEGKFDKIDTDQDGNLTPKEIRTALAEWRKAKVTAKAESANKKTTKKAEKKSPKK